MEIRYSHPDEGLFKAINLLKEVGIEEDSRNGPVRRFPEPVMLINTNPVNRVSLLPARDANPTFHFVEALWMLAGMNELAPLLPFNSNMQKFSDDGMTLRGTAYGHKWRKHFGYDQIDLAVKRLRSNPTDRRVVLTMWDPRAEWRDEGSKDLSCNLQVIFGTREVQGTRYLDMEVTNRSNDLVYGCLGSNVFHFSFLLEYMAFRTGLSVGNYYQVAFNLHGYMENPAFRKVYELPSDHTTWDSHRDLSLSSVRLDLVREMGLPSAADLENFVRTGNPGSDVYLQAVGVPLVEAYRVFKLASNGIKVDKNKRLAFAAEIAEQCADPALALAAGRWYRRKMEALVGRASMTLSADTRTGSLGVTDMIGMGPEEVRARYTKGQGDSLGDL